MQRREFIASLVSAAVAGAFPTSLVAGAAPTGSSKRYPWRNWSGNQECFPEQILAPKNLMELQQLLAESQKKIRLVGAGHSFTPLAVTDEIMVSMRNFVGVQGVSVDNMQATIGAGTTLNKIGPALAAHGQALVNMPDIDQQSLAGAVSTATHGTGRNLNCLSHYIEELALLMPNGELITCNTSRNADLFRCAQVGLGLTGMIVSVTMQNTSAFKLQRESYWSPLEDTLANIDALSRDNRNIEFYYFPFTGMTYIDTLNLTDAPVSEGKELDGNSGLMDLKAARDYLEKFPAIRELILKTYMKTISMETNVDHSYAIYATERNVRFNEMEYHLPVEQGPKALKEIIELIESDFPEVFFPIECRYIKSDECWLSPFYQRDTFSIAVHRYFEEDHRALFAAVEPIFKRHGGRPHWGKLNTLNKEQAKALYPRFDDFVAVRRHYDPNGRFLNPYLESIFA